MTNKLALAVAVALGILSIVGIRTYVERMRKEQLYREQPVDVLVAARDLQPGMTFTRDDLQVRQFPRVVINEAFQNSRVTDENTVVNDIVTAEVQAGQVLQTYHFSTDGGAGPRHKLEGKFGKEDRAMTIPIGAVSGVAGMLRPGDYVDLVFSMPFAGRRGTTTVTYTQFKNVLLLATGNITNPADPAVGTGYSNLTLRLTPAQCNTLKYCLDNGAVMTATYVQPGTATLQGSDPVTADVIYKEVEQELIKKLR